MKIYITILIALYASPGTFGQECANHREKSTQCGATSGSVADKCCDGLLCNKKKGRCKKEKCAKFGERSKECGSPSGLSKCCEGLVCSKRKRRCVEAPSDSPSNVHSSSPTEFPSYSPTAFPTPLNSTSPSLSPTTDVPLKILEGKKCKTLPKDLGKGFVTVEECIAVAKTDPACTGNEVIWHTKYNKYYGCSCCGEHVSCPAPSTDYYSSVIYKDWESHEYKNCKTYGNDVTPNKSYYTKGKMLGKEFTPAQCVEKAKSDSECTGNEIIYSPMYNKYWGCYCAPKQPTCPAASNRYYTSSYWNIYKYSECS